MQSIWNGSITFGLVTIPVRIYTAVKTTTLGFKTLCPKCHSPLNYKRVCAHCNKEIPYQNVVKGLKLSDGNYFIATPESIHALRPERTDTIEILSFIEQDAIDYIYLDDHYYIAPQQAGINAFHLLKDALSATKKVAIGQFVMRDKQYVCIINPYEEALLLTTLHYAYELKASSTIAILKKKVKSSKAEIDLAKKIIAQRTIKKFDISAYKDTFAEKLKEAIKKSKKVKKMPKAKTTTVQRSVRKKQPKETLLDHLKASLKTPSKSSRTVARAKAKTSTKKKL